MTSGTSRLCIPTREAVTMVFIVVGTLLWTWSERSNSEAYEDVVGASFAGDVVREHNRVSARTVQDISELTRDEIHSLYPEVMANLHTASQAEMMRSRMVVLATIGAVGCWLVASLRLLVRRAPLPVAAAQVPTRSAEPTDILAAGSTGALSLKA